MNKITVKVTPRSSKKELLLLEDGTYKAKLTAPPVDGDANTQLIELVAKEFGVAKSLVTIVNGKTSRVKTIEIG
ncbi:MAG: hypothetical protein COU33_01270 [Candidatus Magasanikbacteria bacterium CG10_big_fil_rev_8_21_14_0_10_43_6]|uniref:UPF0235 protein COU33_01270 n=1 Tax=Candidatus Magasanikbacteria bacterium CG10_big_fil_rev_8_21_14_0_10_43_6 TaxID=1974650 RepID=A0A2M6W240_9BACT|nr:MAG: hypothetical protein COU33_01270 [Candidatus Magasanikbacteria bacterium CG10_big_fil_rev_8_21_14_0_10_43_6]